MSEIQYLKGIGPAKAKLFERLEIRTVTDLLHYYPRAYQDRRENAPNSSLNPVSLVVFKGRVLRAQTIPARSVLIFKAFLADEKNNQIECTWFKRRTFRNFRFDPFGTLKKDFKIGAEVWVIGRRENRNNFFDNKITVEEHYPVSSPESALHAGRITPIYGLTEGLTNKQFRQFMHEALTKSEAQNEPDILPSSLTEKRGFISSRQALNAIHFPSGTAELENARARLAYEEFLLLTTAWGIKRTRTKAVAKGYGYEIKKHLLTPFRQNLGFDFTGSQKKVINEIFADLQSPLPMNRLLQGDVGSGKTIVALSAMLLAIENGYQSALMVPTEILAEQHYLTFQKILKKLKVPVAVLTSSTKTAERKKILAALANGSLSIIVGTHALL